MPKRQRRYIFGVPAGLVNGAVIVGGLGGVILAELRDLDFVGGFVAALFFALISLVITVVIFRPQFEAQAQAQKPPKGRRRP
jgi:FtsH-binding integral membrane protein